MEVLFETQLNTSTFSLICWRLTCYVEHDFWHCVDHHFPFGIRFFIDFKHMWKNRTSNTKYDIIDKMWIFFSPVFKWTDYHINLLSWLPLMTIQSNLDQVNLLFPGTFASVNKRRIVGIIFGNYLDFPPNCQNNGHLEKAFTYHWFWYSKFVSSYINFLLFFFRWRICLLDRCTRN